MIKRWIKRFLAQSVREVIKEEMSTVASEFNNEDLNQHRQRIGYKTNIRPIDVEKYLKTTNSNPSKPRIRNQHLSREALEEHYNATVGVWVIDRDPREVSKEWINKNAYQIMGLVTTKNGL